MATGALKVRAAIGAPMWVVAATGEWPSSTGACPTTAGAVRMGAGARKAGAARGAGARSAGPWSRGAAGAKSWVAEAPEMATMERRTMKDWSR